MALECTYEQFTAAVERVEQGATPEPIGDPGDAWSPILAFVAGTKQDLRSARVLLEIAQRRTNDLERFVRDLTALVEIRCTDGVDATSEILDVIRRFRDRPKRQAE